MKTALLTLLVLTLAIPAAFAEVTTAANGESKDHPCVKIQQACNAAGFAKGGAKERKGLFANCVKPILDGQDVPGVTVDAATIQACQNIKAKRDQRRDSNKNDPVGPNKTN